MENRRANATKNFLEKDYNKLTNKLAQCIEYQKSIVKQQEDVIKLAIKKKEEMIIRRESVKKKLQKYVTGKEIDQTYKDLKWEYESCLEGIESLNTAISVAEESIEEVKLGMAREI